MMQQLPPFGNFDKHLKCILSSALSDYYKHWQLFQNENYKMIKNWTVCDISLDVIVHCVQHCNDPMAANESEDKKLKSINTAWKFLDFLSLYFQQQRFDGPVFLNGIAENDEIGGAGFAKRIVKAICTQYGEKSGRYTRVKRQLSTWAKRKVRQHGWDQSKMLIANICREAKIPNELQHIISLHFPNLDDTVKNKTWYWFKDKNGSQWRPFDSVDCRRLNFAWLNMSKSCLVGNGHFRVEFDRSNVLVPRGNKINQSTRTATVICSELNMSEKWYWLCDEDGIKWIPYRDEHQKIMNDAWMNPRANHVIVMERFKIDFHRSNAKDHVPSGLQYNYQKHNGWGRDVIRGKPDTDGTLNGIPCDKEPG